MTQLRYLTSPNAKCRVLGCSSSVPPQGYYAGLPQAHCPRCGMKTSIASPGCKDFDEPTYPEAAGIYVIIDWFRRRKERKRREKRAMQVYDAKGCAKDVPEPQNKVRFRDLEKGDVFKQSGRILIKTNPISIIDRFDPLGHDGQVNMKRFNAVQLTGKQGSKSCISDDTMVERFPNAAIYLRG